MRKLFTSLFEGQSKQNRVRNEQKKDNNDGSSSSSSSSIGGVRQIDAVERLHFLVKVQSFDYLSSRDSAQNFANYLNNYAAPLIQLCFRAEFMNVCTFFFSLPLLYYISISSLAVFTRFYSIFRNCALFNNYLACYSISDCNFPTVVGIVGCYVCHYVQ